MVTSGSEVLVATHLLVEGQHITEADVSRVEVGSGLPQEYEVNAQSVVGRVVTRAIHSGELIPRSSVGEPAETLETTLVIDLAAQAATSLSEGSEIDIWAAPAKASSGATPLSTVDPHIVVSHARLARRLDRTTGSLSTAERVEVVVSRMDIPDLLSSIARGDAITVVAANGGLIP